MEITRVACNGCGGALEVGAGARFVTCRYCGASLEIKRTASAVFTEVLERIDQRTAAMAEDLGALRREQELERVDREWALRKQSLMARARDGAASAPSMFGGAFSIVVGVVGGIAFMGFAASGHAPSGFPLFGLLFIGVAVAAGLRSMIGAKQYSEEENAYREERRRIIAKGRFEEEQQRAGSGRVS